MNNERLIRAPYEVSTPRYSVAHQMVTTAFDMHGFRVTQGLGVVRGIVVRSRNLFVNIGARYDTTEISSGVTEVLAYGTAVIVQPTEEASYRS